MTAIRGSNAAGTDSTGSGPSRRGWRYRGTPTGPVMYETWIDRDPENAELTAPLLRGRRLETAPSRAEDGP